MNESYSPEEELTGTWKTKTLWPEWGAGKHSAAGAGTHKREIWATPVLLDVYNSQTFWRRHRFPRGCLPIRMFLKFMHFNYIHSIM